MSTYKKIVKSSFRDLSKKLGVTDGFIIDIHDDKNSWSFISKLAQFIEGVFTRMLVQRLNEPEIFGSISNLPQATRINLCYELGIVSKEQKFLFLTIAEVRNDYIHEISNFNVNLVDYFSKFKDGRKKEIFKRFQHFFNSEEPKLEDFFNDSQNQIFTICALEISRCFGSVEGLDAKRKHDNFRADQALKLIPKMKEDVMYIGDRIAVIDHVTSAREVLKKNSLL